MAYLKNPENHKLSEFRDKTIHQHNGKHYVRCCLCSVRMRPEQLNMEYRICDFCKEFNTTYNILGTVYINNLRSQEKELESTLTPSQWSRCIKYFHLACAYCETPTIGMDHVIPISHGGGTTVYNCLPACANCNSIKGSKTYFPGLSEERARKIEEYFALPDLENPPFLHNPLKILQDSLIIG